MGPLISQTGWQECGSHPSRMLSCCSKIVAVLSVMRVFVLDDFFGRESEPIKPSASIYCRCFRPPVQIRVSSKVHPVRVSWRLKLSDSYKTKIVSMVSPQRDVLRVQIALFDWPVSVSWEDRISLDWWHFTLESISVGCVPPARYHTGDLPDRDPRTETPLDRDPSQQRPPPKWTESQTGVKTLPCRNFVAGCKNGPLQILQMVF